MTRGLKFLLAALALGSVACVSSQEIPPMTGPSEFALSVGLTASPNTITQDGVSQSVITVSAHDSSGKPVVGGAFRLDMFVGGLAVTYGTLSARTIVTGGDGKATVVYTAPPALPGGAVPGECSPAIFSPYLPGLCVTIAATPIGTNGFSAGTNTSMVEVHLIPMVQIPVAGAPIADFTFTPSTVKINAEMYFNASGSAAASGRTLVSYIWDWNDGTKGSGITEDHDWIAAGTYYVSLTVTDDAGNKTSVTKPVVVTP